MIRVITAQSLVQEMYRDWKYFHYKHSKDSWWHDKNYCNKTKSPQQIYEEMMALGEAPEVEDINKIFGMKYCAVDCSSCGNKVDWGIEICVALEEGTICLCPACARKVGELMK